MKMAMKGFVTAETIPFLSICNQMSPQSTRQIPKQLPFFMNMLIRKAFKLNEPSSKEVGLEDVDVKSESERSLLAKKQAYRLLQRRC